MSGFQKPVCSDFIAEMQRLLIAQTAAHQAGDHEAIELADHDMAHFLRMNEAGRLQEYMANRRETR